MSVLCQELLLTSLTNYYRSNNNIITLKNIIEGRHRLSLRMIDWFVTHYSNTYKIFYWIHKKKDEVYIDYPSHLTDTENIKKISLYNDYRGQLKSYAKINFDSFRRHNRITFIIDENNVSNNIETTVGQLNFFRWIFNNNILQYAIINYDNIYNNMVSNNSYSKNKKITKFVDTNDCIATRREIINTKCILRFD